MKKLIVFVCAFCVVIGIAVAAIVRFDVVERVEIWKNGLSAYNADDFEITYENVDKISKTIDMKEYNGEEIELLKYNDNVSIVIENIEFRQDTEYDSYFIYVTCKGYSDYSFGQVFYLENQLDIEIETSEGTFIMGARGLGFDGDNRCYTYYLYPEETMDIETMLDVEINLEIDDIRLVTYNRYQ